MHFRDEEARYDVCDGGDDDHGEEAEGGLKGAEGLDALKAVEVWVVRLDGKSLGRL